MVDECIRRACGGGFRPPSKSGFAPANHRAPVPGHEVVLAVLRMLAGPLVLSSANLGGQVEAVTGQQVLDALGDRIDLVLDDGPCRFGEPSSVVRVEGSR